MGLLDDAIREHLDLKRRRGADPAEVARAEHEALGPVRREPAPADAADEHDEEHREHAPEPAAAEPHAEEQPTHNAPHPADEGLHPDEATHVLAPEDRHEPPHGDPFRAQPGDIVHQPTTEFRVEDHHDDEPVHEHHEHHEAPQAHPPQQPVDENVLEETPDFLQETPEHDRLWFEQRPPRDFDFDG